MANYEATRYNWDGEFLSSVQGINTGLIIPWSSSTIPAGFQECNGTAINRTTFAALFAVIGTTYGVGDGTTTFNLPNLTDRTVVNKSNTKNLAQTGGANTVTRTGNIGGSSGSTTISSAQMPSHSHPGMLAPSGGIGQGEGGSAYSKGFNSTSAGAGSGQGHTHNLSANFTGGADSVLQPFIVMIYIIKT